VVADEEDVISSASEDTQSIDRVQQQLLFHGDGNTQQSGDDAMDSSDRLRRVHELLQNKWPYKIGLLHTVWGVVLLLLGQCLYSFINIVIKHGVCHISRCKGIKCSSNTKTCMYHRKQYVCYFCAAISMNYIEYNVSWFCKRLWFYQ